MLAIAQAPQGPAHVSPGVLLFPLSLCCDTIQGLWSPLLLLLWLLLSDLLTET